MRTGLQVLQEIQDRLGDRQATTIEGTLTNDTRKLLRLMNRVLKNMVSAEKWPMLRTQGQIITQAPLQDDMLLDLTNGSITVSISEFDSSTITFEQSHLVWGIQLGTGSPIYRIAKVVSPTQLELNKPWLGDSQTITSADDDTIAVKMAMDRYALPEDFDRPTGEWKDFLSAYDIEPLPAEKFAETRRSRGRDIELSNPTFYTIHGLDPSSTYQVLHLEPWPQQQTMLEFDYQHIHPEIEVDNDLVLFPQTQLSVIIEATIYLANRDYKDDERMTAALQEYLQQFNAARGQRTVTDEKKQITPWMRNRARSTRVQRSGVRIDYGDAFDRSDMTDLP